MTGEDCSQPPDGVAVNMLPALSMTSMCTVSPMHLAARARPLLVGAVAGVQMRANVGSPAPAPTARAPLTMTRPP